MEPAADGYCSCSHCPRPRRRLSTAGHYLPPPQAASLSLPPPLDRRRRRRGRACPRGCPSRWTRGHPAPGCSPRPSAPQSAPRPRASSELPTASRTFPRPSRLGHGGGGGEGERRARQTDRWGGWRAAQPPSARGEAKERAEGREGVPVSVMCAHTPAHPPARECRRLPPWTCRAHIGPARIAGCGGGRSAETAVAASAEQRKQRPRTAGGGCGRPPPPAAAGRPLLPARSSAGNRRRLPQAAAAAGRCSGCPIMNFIFPPIFHSSPTTDRFFPNPNHIFPSPLPNPIPETLNPIPYTLNPKP